jgi:polysaccharide export outer membrane protein
MLKKGITFPLMLIAVFASLLSGCTYQDQDKDPMTPLAPAKLQAYEEVNVIQKTKSQVDAELDALQTVTPEAYTIAAGDKFDFKIYDNEELNATGLLVTPDGYIALNLIGPVKIGGLTIEQAIKLIESKYKKFIHFPKISLIALRIQSSTYTISGKVSRPGRYSLKENTRITDAIAAAKGFATGIFDTDTVEMADLSGAYIVRDGNILPIDFTKAIRKGDFRHNILLRNGDYIYIPSSMNQSVYIIGEVAVPGYLGFKDSLTLLNAITFSRGLLDTASENAWVIRGGLVQPKVYKVNVDMVLRGRALDFPLQANDIIYIPKGGLSKYNEVVEKILPTLEALNLMAGPFGNASVSVNNNGN